MVTEALYKALPFVAIALDCLLCAVMLLRGRMRQFPALCSLAAVDLCSSVVLYVVEAFGTKQTYFWTYSAFDICSFLLQLLVLFEIARNVLKPAGVWERGAFKTLFSVAVLGALLAFFATMTLQPPGARTGQALQLRADVFAGLFTCEIVIAMMLSASQFGLPWRSHVMAIGQGLMLWALVGAFVEGLEVYLGPHHRFYALYYIRSINYLVVLTYWTVSLWRNEPARRPISPALRKYVIALHESVQYDIGKVGH